MTTSAREDRALIGQREPECALEPHAPDESRFASVARGGMLMTVGTLLGHGAAVLVSPLITRLYSPADIGVLASYLVIMAVAGVFVSLGYEAAIPLERTASRATAVARLSLWLAGASSLVSLVVSAVLLRPLASLGWFDGAFVCWLAVGIFLTGAFQVGNSWRLQRLQFALVAAGRAIQGIGAAGLQLVAGLFSVGVVGLLGGQVFGLAAASLVLLWAFGRAPEERAASRPRLLALARRHRAFPLYMSPALLINILSQHAPVIVIGLVTTLDVVGFYALTYRVLTGPALLLGHSVGQSFYAQVSRRNTGHAELVGDLVSAMLRLGLPFFVWIVATGPSVFAFVFGQEWEQAGLFARYMAPWLALNLATSTVSQYVLVAGKQRAALAFTAFTTALRLGALVLGAATGSVTMLVLAFSAAGVAIALVYGAWMFRLAGVDQRRWIARHTGPLLLAAALAAFSLSNLSPLGDTWTQVLVTVVCAGWTLFELKGVSGRVLRAPRSVA